ncbi:hypothetical protein KJ708_01475 [bacterium]|nr:hypothetical protein [bacterium]
MEVTKLIKFITLIVVLCGICILLIFISPIPDQLRDGIIAEIVSGGILSAIVAGIFFYLQESSEFQASKNKAESFFKNNLLSDIEEVAERGASIWNLSGLNKFYFDGATINPLFDVYKNNLLSINDFSAYFPENTLIKEYNHFYRLTRKGYVLGEKLENIIRQHVRAEHHKQNIIAVNDNTTVMYIKGKLFVNLPDKDLIKHLEWQTVPERAKTMLAQFDSATNLKEVVAQLEEIRAKLMKSSDKIIQLAKQGYKNENSKNGSSKGWYRGQH